MSDAPLIRPMVDDDRAFVISGWSSSYRLSRDSIVPMAMWADTMHAVVGHYLARLSTRVLVAHRDTLWGFLAYDLDYVFYCYVAQPFRKGGVARALFDAAGIDPGGRFGYLCRTRASWELQQAGKIPGARYDPFRARFEPEIERKRA